MRKYKALTERINNLAYTLADLNNKTKIVENERQAWFVPSVSYRMILNMPQLPNQISKQLNGVYKKTDMAKRMA
jgi:hypothetical protein